MTGGRARRRIAGKGSRAPRARASEQGHASSAAGGVRRGAAALRRAGNAAAAALLERLGPGKPLASGERTRFERAFGEDLRGVRVVEDAAAAGAAAAADAAGFASGDTVVLDPGTDGRSRAALLAHEVAHVVQQRRAGVASTVSDAGDRSERSAERAGENARRGHPAPPARVPAAAPGPVPAVQRQMRKDVLTRAQARERIARYLEGQLTRQGGQTIAVTPEIKAMLRRIFLNDFSGMLKLDAYLSRTTFPGNPADLAAAVARLLPDYLPKSRLAHLEASTGPSPTSLERVKGAISKTEPYVSPEAQKSQWEFGRMAKEARKGEETVGPYGVDIQRIIGVGKELSKPKGPPPRVARARTYASVEKAVATIDRDALVPAAARGTKAAGDYADARELARSIAADLDIAQQRREDTVALHLGPAYAGVKEKTSLASEVARIVRLVRDALPHGASEVAKVEVYFGERVVRVVSFRKAAE